MERILPANPGAGYLRIKAEVDQAVLASLESQYYILGSQVAAFELEFAAYVGVAHGIGVANGTDALVLALRAAGVGPGSLVLTVPNTAVATVAAIELAGAEPLLADIDPKTHLLDLDRLRRWLADGKPERLKAIIPVHLFGRMVDMPRLLEIANLHGLWVIEDCAQAHGAVFGGRRAGSYGLASAFSFYPTKNLGAFGDGGFVATNDPGIAERVRLLRQYGWRQRYISEIPGMNSRLDEIQAAILRVRLPHLEEDNAARCMIARRYDEGLRHLPVDLPSRADGGGEVFHQYTVSLDARDALRKHLEERGVLTAVLYPVPIHLQPGYRGRIPTAGELAGAEWVARRLLCLPMYPELPDEAVDRVIDGVRAFFGRAD